MSNPSSPNYLRQIEAENLALDQELTRLQLQVPDSDSLRYSALSSRPLQLPAHRCKRTPSAPVLRTGESLCRRVKGVEAAARELQAKISQEEERIRTLETTLADKQAEIEDLQARADPHLYHPSVVAKTSLTQVTRKKQRALEEKIRSQAAQIEENRKTMQRFQQLNHDLLYRAKGKLDEETETQFALRSDQEVLQKLKELRRDGEIMRGKNEGLAREVREKGGEVGNWMGRREDLEAELRRFEESTRSLYQANKTLRENLIKLMQTV